MSMFCKIVGPSSDIHKLPEIPKTFKELHAIVLKKFGHEVSDKFSLKYKDSDDELITICNDDDIQTAILTTQSENQKTLRILVLPDTSSQSTQDDKARSFQIQVSPPKTESSERPSLFGRDQFAEEPYIGQLDYISSDPGKLADESGDLRKIIEQLPSTLDFRRSMSHNPQVEPARFQENQDNGRYFDGREIFDKVPPRHGSPGIAEDILNNGFFNEDQMKVIVGIVEQKVAEKIEEKISSFSNEIIAKFQDEVRTMGIGRGGTNSSFKGMSMPYGSRMGLRRNKETQESDQPKDCSNCNKRIAGIKYNCLTCRDFTCCEDCENIINHEHPLLKIRPGKANETAKAENAVEKEDNADFMQSMTTSTRFQPRASENTNMNSSTNINSQQDTIQPTIYQERKRVNMENMSSSASWGAGRIDSGMIQPSGRLSTQVYANKDSNSYNPRRIEASGQGSRVLFKSSTMDLQSPTNFVSPNVKSNPRASEFKQYKVALVKPPLYEVTTVKAGHHYNINFTIKNNGELKWPDDTKLICIDGVHKGDEFGLPALNPGNTYIVDLHLQAPWELGRFFNEWKVHYTKDGAPKSFGKEISIEIEVVDGDKADKDRAKREKVEKQEKTPQIDIDRESRGSLQSNKNLLADDDKKLMKEFECSEQILKHAKVLQDLVCTGSLKEKVEFIKNCSSEWSLNQIVSAYLNTPTKLKNVAGGNPTPQ